MTSSRDPYADDLPFLLGVLALAVGVLAGAGLVTLVGRRWIGW